MNSEEKKKLVSDYKEREITGCVYAIKNNATGKTLLDAAQDMDAIRNRFAFSKTTGSAVSGKLQTDWKTYGADAFSFEVLEELKKGRDQTQREYSADLALLKELWLEKRAGAALY